MSKHVGRYEILEELGRGAMGVVYLGRDPVIGRKLAIKTIRIIGLLQTDGAQEFLARFYQEAKAAGKLSHPGIVTVFDVGQDEESGMHYLVMEYVPGPNLKFLLQDTSFTFTPHLVARIGVTVAEALHYAHQHQVIHRDVKPANIILSSRDVIKLTDFGIAKLPQSELTSDGQFVGTPSYMSPEQIKGDTIDSRSDIFSLGIVLYELLTRKKPFPGEDLATVSHRIAYEPPLPMDQLAPQAPPELVYAVDRALSKDPDKRFTTAGEMAQVIRAFLSKSDDAKQEKTQMLSMADASLEDTQVTEVHPETPASGPSPSHPKASRPGLIARYRAFKESIKDNPHLGFLALPIYFKWIFLLLFIALIIFGTPVLLLTRSLHSANSRIKPAVGIHRVEQRVALLDECRKAIKAGDSETARRGLKKLLCQTPLASYPISLYDRVGEGEQQPEEVQTPETPPEPTPKESALARRIRRGKSLYRRGEYTDAKREFKRVLKADPGNRTARKYLSMINVKQEILRQKYEKAQTFKEAPKAAPSGPVVPPNRPSALHFTYDSPIGEGFLVINVDDRQVYRKSFSFVKKSGLFKKKITFLGGSLEGDLTLTPGSHKVRVWIVSKGKEKVNTYEVKPIKADPAYNYNWSIKLDVSANKITFVTRETPYAPDSK